MRLNLTLCSLKNEHRWSIQNVKPIPGEFQHALVVADIDKKKIRNIVKKTCTGGRKISLLKDEKIRKRLPNWCRPLRSWKTRPEKERRGRPNRHHSIPAPRERGLIQPFFR